MRAVTCFLTGTALLGAGLSLGQPPKPAFSFSAYSTAERYHGVKAAPRLKPNTPAWFFRTSIREAAKGEANFAGHYVVATWGCGMECESYAIINQKTGEVFYTSTTVCCQSSAGPEGFGLIEYRPNSRLIVFSGMLNEKGSAGAHYYKFGQGKLIALR